MDAPLIKAGTELWFAHRCSGHHMLVERLRNSGLGMDARVKLSRSSTHERNYGLGMDALFKSLFTKT